MSYASLHARLINRKSFSADEIKAIIVQVPDVRLIEYFLEGTDFIPVRRQVARYEGAVTRLPVPADVVAVQREASRK